MREGGLLGWATEALIRADDEMPGVIARTLTAAPRRRQAIFAALAARDVMGGVFDVSDELLPRSFAEVARHGRVADILRHAFGEVPEGMAGMLERVGEREREVGDRRQGAFHALSARRVLLYMRLKSAGWKTADEWAVWIAISQCIERI